MPNIIEWPILKGLLKYALPVFCHSAVSRHVAFQKALFLFHLCRILWRKTNPLTVVVFGFFSIALSTFKLHVRFRQCQVHNELSGQKCNHSFNRYIIQAGRERKCRSRLHDQRTATVVDVSGVSCGASRKRSCISIRSYNEKHQMMGCFVYLLLFEILSSMKNWIKTVMFIYVGNF